ncbi:ABC transporter transmembrane domain-containing protein [Agrobacterium sp. P15N1-A]|uniref:ABC transporter transmembrane domain-containing protein n=1 Tax=Agrobacterium sp. P15N1-A TaxID=3342820 RepID=UPI0037D6174D
MTSRYEEAEERSYAELAATHVSMRCVLGLFSAYAGRPVAILLVILTSSVAGIAAPFLLRAIIDDALPNGNLGLLALLAGGLIALACIGTAIEVFHVITSKVGQSIMRDLRMRVYTHLQSLSLGFFTATRTGEVQARIVSDIGGLQALVTHTGSELMRNISIVVMTTIAMLALEWRMALFSFLVLPMAIWISHRVRQLREEITYEQQQRIANMSSAVQEMLSISGIILARTMGRTGHLTRRFIRTS